MIIQENISLKPYNTFGIEVNATELITIYSESDLIKALTKYHGTPLLVLGGGSNILFTKAPTQPVLLLKHTGIEIITETVEHVWVKVQGGENWHSFVLWCLDHGFGGVENLSLIPGNVGTSPMQNIGAYGIELKDVFYECETICVQTLEKRTFNNEDCNFGYRESVFKTTEKGNYIITNVTFKLSKQNHELHTGYGDIQRQLENKNIVNPTIKDVSDAVIAIRSSKLPDPAKLGNSGSFFKNPVVDAAFFETFQVQHPNAPFYSLEDGSYKIPAGWLIEQCGFKGQRTGDAGVHEKQALVIVNYGNATGNELWELAQKIQSTVLQIFKIKLEAEVNIV